MSAPIRPLSSHISGQGAICFPCEDTLDPLRGAQVETGALSWACLALLPFLRKELLSSSPQFSFASGPPFSRPMPTFLHPPASPRGHHHGALPCHPSRLPVTPSWLGLDRLCEMMAITAALLGPGQEDPEQQAAELSPADRGTCWGQERRASQDPSEAAQRRDQSFKALTWSLAQTLLYDLGYLVNLPASNGSAAGTSRAATWMKP